MKIFVTGATGFLGKTLCKKLKEIGHEVVGVGSKLCDLTKDGSLDAYSNQKFDQIYHLAVWVQAGDFNMHHQGEVWVKNQKINTNILSWWKESQPQAKLIAMGTSCSYPHGMELLEDNYLLGTPHSSIYYYAMTKRMLYIGLQALNVQFGLDYLYLIPNTLYGPGYHNETKQPHFIFDLIRKIKEAKDGAKAPVLWGDGYQKRELVFVEDFVEIMFKLASTTKNTLLNIGPGKEHTIREYAKEVSSVLGYDSNHIQYDTTKFVGARSKCFTNTKLLNTISDCKFTSLREGLEKTINWYLEEAANRHISV